MVNSKPVTKDNSINDNLKILDKIRFVVSKITKVIAPDRILFILNTSDVNVWTIVKLYR
ncbi:hypothetical protein [Romboutsia sp.]|uniref:hypothetical protein n=1 Tax=Romboutsia sp. TaxID=1965302 RepID=UPI003F31CFA3